MDVSQFEAEIRQRYDAVRAWHPDATPLTLLHIGAEQTGVVVGHESEPHALLTLEIGSHKTARDYFRHTPPSPLEMENAIVTVEDEVARARALIPPESRLHSTDPALREIALLCGVDEAAQMQLSIEAMERIFDRLTSVVLGRPSAHEGLPTANTFAATLLILREFMHHMQFSRIALLEPTARANTGTT